MNVDEKTKKQRAPRRNPKYELRREGADQGLAGMRQPRRTARCCTTGRSLPTSSSTALALIRVHLRPSAVSFCISGRLRAILSEVRVVIEDQRGVVGEADVLVDAGLAGAVGRTGAGHVVVDPPADVVVPGPAPIRPPGVLLGPGVDAAEGVVHADRTEHLVHPGPLFGQEAGVLPVTLPVLQIDFLVRDIPVTADDPVAPGFRPFLEPGLEVVHAFVLELLPLVLGRS